MKAEKEKEYCPPQKTKKRLCGSSLGCGCLAQAWSVESSGVLASEGTEAECVESKGVVAGKGRESRRPNEQVGKSLWLRLGVGKGF